MLCPEHEIRAAMTDQEFWEHVFSWTDPGDHFTAYDEDIYAIECARCGCTVEVDDPEHRERDAFCDECASETMPYESESNLSDGGPQ